MLNRFLLIICILQLSLVSEIVKAKEINVAVSILPQKYFVERLAGERVNVSVIVPAGFNPVTYEPTPKQLMRFSQCQLFFSIGVPFEAQWMLRLTAANDKISMVDLRDGIALRTFHNTTHSHHHVRDTDDREITVNQNEKYNHDPHIWLSPRNAIAMAKTITKSLVEVDAAHRGEYERNLRGFIVELEQLDKRLRDIIKESSVTEFLVFHPSWGYFADDYGLKQIAIESEGKQPKARMLAKTIDYAKYNNIKFIFVQKQFSTTVAKRIASAIGARVVQIDPLSENYIANLERAALAISGSKNGNEYANRH